MYLSSATVVAFLAATAIAQIPVDGFSSPPSYPSPWVTGQDPDWAEAYQKAQAFVSQLTLLEKVNITTGVGWEGEACVGNTGSVPRLNFAGFCFQDSPLGVRDTDQNSAFPAGINAAATWSTKLINARGLAMGQEHNGKGVDMQLGPVAGPLGRVPAGGRNWEGFSPDPVLTGVAIAETIKGIQDAGVIACAKHYIMNEQERFREPDDETPTNKFAFSANLDDATMHELYLWPFADAVRAGAGAIMASYNQINNSYGSQNAYTINYLLKNELNFQGVVISDWWAQHTGVASTLAGLDVTMAGDSGLASGFSWWGANLTASVLNGTIPQFRLDDMAVRLMSAFYKVGRDKARVPVNFNSWNLSTFGFAHPQGPEDFEQINFHVNVQDDHAKLIREIGGASTVLLKNKVLSTTRKAVLPLSKPKSIAVIGDDAHDNPSGPNGCPDRGCSSQLGNTGTLAMGWGSGTANFPYLVAPITALKTQAAHDRTALANVSDNYNLAAIANAVVGAEAALVFVNADSGERYITVDGNGGDRNNLTLWGNGDALIDYVSSLNPNTIVVIHSVGPVTLDQHKNNPNITAILWAGLPGQESGNAIVDVLYGAVNPQAKSVFTWGKTREDYGVDVVYDFGGQDPPQLNFNEGVFIDYRHFDAANIEPSYEFGFGLSYTSFKYSNLKIDKKHVGPYVPTTGLTPAAPTFGTIDTDPANALFPPGWHHVPLYIYPFLSDTNVDSGLPQDWPAGAQDSTPQPLLPASGSPGGNAGLYDVLYRIRADVTNVGPVQGTEIAQLYLSLGGPSDPVRVLRGFSDAELSPGQTRTVTFELTRRDLSNWDTASQNWVISSFPKTVFVGASSRNLALQSVLG